MISEEPCNTQTRAGYRSKIFDIDIDNLDFYTGSWTILFSIPILLNHF